MKKEEKDGRKNVWLAGLASLFNDIGSEMITPILPLFLLSFGASGLAIGLVGGLREGLASIIKVIFGYWSDKIGKRKPFVVLGYVVSSVSKLLLFLSKAAGHVMIFTSLDRLGKGIRDSPRDVIVSESMKEHRGAGFGIHRALDSLGGVLGALIVVAMFWYFKMSFTTIIFIAGIVSLISIIPLIAMKDVKTKDHKFDLRKLKMTGKLKFFFLISAIFSLANFSYLFFVLKAKYVFPGKYEILLPILLYALFYLVYSIFAYPFGKLGDKSGKKRILMVGYLLFFFVNIGFLLFSSIYAYIALFVLYGLVFAMTQGNQVAYVADHCDERSKGTTIGLFYGLTGLMAILSGICVGLLWDVSMSYVFIFGAVLSLVSFVLMFWARSVKVKKTLRK